MMGHMAIIAGTAIEGVAGTGASAGIHGVAQAFMRPIILGGGTMDTAMEVDTVTEATTTITEEDTADMATTTVVVITTITAHLLGGTTTTFTIIPRTTTIMVQGQSAMAVHPMPLITVALCLQKTMWEKDRLMVQELPGGVLLPEAIPAVPSVKGTKNEALM